MRAGPLLPLATSSRSPAIPDLDPFRGRPLFIFGCPRSGTSVLTRMLGTHSSLAIPYESHLYNRVYPLVRRHGFPAGREGLACLVGEILRTDYIRQWSPPPGLEETLAAVTRDGFHGVVEGVLRAWTAARGKTRWGEKTPQHTLWWRTILEGFPDLQVIHLIRDGRDVALSYRAAHFGPKHVYPLARRWAEYLEVAAEARAAIGPAGFLDLRYEDLLREPERELRRVCGFLGEAFQPAMLDFYRDPVAYPTDAHNEGNLRRPVLSNNAEKWRTGMTGRELRIFEALAGPWLERLGYERARPGARVSRLEALSCRLLEHPPRRAAAMVRNRQGRRLALERLRLELRLRRGC